MKRVGIGIVLLLEMVCTRAQSLGGIFSQGTTELNDNTTQILVLQELGATDEQDYAGLEDGLTGMGQIHGAEYALHRDYFGSLSAVNPTVAGMPEVADIVQTVPAGLGDLAAAIGRWGGSGGMTATSGQSGGNGGMTTGELAGAIGLPPGGGGMTTAELGALVSLDSSLSRLGASELAALQVVLTAGQLVMTDAERMARVRAIDRAVREQYLFILQTCGEGDLLVARRRQAVGEAGAGLLLSEP